MPRTAPAIEADTVYYGLIRGNGCSRLSHSDGDYEALERVLTEGLSRYPVDLRPALRTTTAAAHQEEGDA